MNNLATALRARMNGAEWENFLIELTALACEGRTLDELIDALENVECAYDGLGACILADCPIHCE